MKILIVKNYMNHKIGDTFNFDNTEIDSEGTLTGVVISPLACAILPAGVWRKSFLSEDVTLVNIDELNLPKDFYDEMVTHLELCNGAASYFNVNNTYFKRTEEFRKILIENGVPLDKKIFIR